jgi:lysophospholipase L1-like esterase
MVQCVGFVGQGVNKIHSSVDQNLWGESDDVIVLAGVNDLASRRGVQHVVEGLERIYQEARVRGARVIAVELTPWGGHVRGRHLIDETREVNSWLDRSPSVEMVVNTSGLGIEGHLRPEYDSGDGLHLNAAGQQRLGSIIYEQVYMS